jgi:transposase
LVGHLLERWPTLQALQQTRPATLDPFFRQHRYGPSRIQQRLQQIAQALPAINDPAVLQFAAPAVRTLVKLIGTLREGITELDQQIRQLATSHEDFAIFDSLPGAGPALVPRLIAAFGTRRDRYRSASQMQCYSGIAPVVERSGNKQWTHFRWHCPKFLHQTFHEWAGCSIRFSD